MYPLKQLNLSVVSLCVMVIFEQKKQATDFISTVASIMLDSVELNMFCTIKAQFESARVLGIKTARWELAVDGLGSTSNAEALVIERCLLTWNSLSYGILDVQKSFKW